MTYSEFIKDAKEQIKKMELGVVVDEFDQLTELKKLITARQKRILEFNRKPKKCVKDSSKRCDKCHECDVDIMNPTY